ncbi:hypothetical protein TNCV_2284911 [Trichonephila clavipes]|nr:hypothetical protein TNCV_2284911 [Trichonephila clavipes]
MALMDVGVHCMKPQKVNTLQPFPEQSKLEVTALWSGECFPGILWVHSSLWKAQWINASMHLPLWTMPIPSALLFLRIDSLPACLAAVCSVKDSYSGF